jgi:hypothetical protein
MPTTPNPDTHCTSFSEVLSLYSHCWKCQYPPMDPKQDKPACSGQCATCPCQPITQTTTVTASANA